MTVYIFSNRISGELGYDKSLISTANFLSTVYDVKIITFGLPLYNSVNSQPTAFELNDDIEVISLRNFPLKTSNVVEKKYSNYFSENAKTYRTVISNYDHEVLTYLNDNYFDENDFMIVSNEVSAHFIANCGVDLKLKTMVQVHFDLRRCTIPSDVIKKTYGEIDYIQPVAKNMTSDLMKITGKSKEDIIWIPNFLNDNVCETSKEDSGFIELGIIGSITKRKGQHEAVKMMKYIKADNVRLNIFGEKGKDNASHIYNEELEEMVAGQENIIIRGYKTEEEIFSLVDIVLIPSEVEGYPYVLLEALKYGKPVVTYDYNYGSDEGVCEGKNGYIVKQGDVKKLAECVTRIVESNEKINEFGEYSRNMYINDYSSKVTLNRYCDIIGKNNVKSSKIARNEILKEYNNQVKCEKKSTSECEIFTFTYKLNSFYKDFSEVIQYRAQKNNSITFTKNNDVVSFDVEFPKGASKTAFYLLVVNGVAHYIFNTNPHGEVSIHSYYMTGKDLNKSNSDFDFALSSDNWIIKNYASRRINSVYADNAKEKRVIVNYLKCDGIFQDVILVPKEHSKVEIHFAGGEIVSYQKPVESYLSCFEILNSIDQNKEIQDYTVDGVYLWEAIKPFYFYNLYKSSTSSSNVSDTLKLDRESYVDIREKTATEFSRNVFLLDNEGKMPFFVTSDDTVILKDSLVSGTVGTNVFSNMDFNDYFRETKMDIDERYKYHEFLEKIKNTFAHEKGYVFEPNINLDTRVKMHILEREYWKEKIKKYGIENIYVTNTLWHTGLIEACNICACQINDLQYALTSKIHPAYGIPKLHYKISNLYTWSKFWADNSNLDSKHTLHSYYDQPNNSSTETKYFEYFNKHVLDSYKNVDTEFDVCILSQYVIYNEFIEYTKNLKKQAPELKIAYCCHPRDEINIVEEKLEGIDVSVVIGNTYETIAKSKKVVGSYSTTVLEAAYMEKMVYVLQIQGSEILKGMDGVFVEQDFDDYVLKDYEINKKDCEELF